MKRNTCSKCGNHLSDGNKFCPGCGTRSESVLGAPDTELKTCSSCSAALAPEHQFCSNCGTRAPALPGSGRADGKAAPAEGEAHRDSLPVAAGHYLGADAVESRETTAARHDDRCDSRGPVGYLTIVSSPDRGKSAAILEDLTIGTNPNSDLHLAYDSYASHHHARVIVEEAGAIIEDLDSRNGTFVETRGKHTLRDGDKVLIGTTVLEFRTDRPTDTSEPTK